MKYLKKVLVLTIIFISIVLLAGCGKKTFLVDFETGTNLIVEAQEIKKGDLVEKPEEKLEKAGFEFVFWEFDDQEYDFDTPVTKSFTLKARWKEIITYLVTFNTDGGTEVASQIVLEGENAFKPRDTKKDGYGFVEWQLDGQTFDFNAPITKAITLTAIWKELTNIEEDMYLAEKYLTWVTNYISFPNVGEAHGSTIEWEYDKNLINSNGIVLFPKKGEQAIETEVVGIFKLGSETKELRLNLVINPVERLYVDNFETYNFTNLTTEFEVENSTLDLYFEDRANVPYVKLVEFFELLKGFIDPEVEFTYTKKNNYLKVYYEYYDEDEDKIYELICELDVLNNTIKTNDPGFFWAYILETETNYGRHIFYDRDHEDISYMEGEDVVFELDKYGLYMGSHDGDVVLPFYLANQIFAGSSYYNVYFNGDGLFGIYSLPDKDSDEYKTMKESSKNEQSMPADLVAHNYHMLAFNLDYFYGLKDIMKVDSYYSYLEKHQKNLLSTNPRTIDTTLTTLLLKDIDEPHTSFGYPSYYNDAKWAGPPQSSLNDYGERFQNWYETAYQGVDNAIKNKFGREGISASEWSANSKSRPDYWFLNNTHAVLILDSFVTADIEESSKFENEIINKLLKFEDEKKDFLPSIDGGSKYYYYQNSDSDNKYVETLVYGLSESYLTTYTNALINKGFEHVIEDTGAILKKNGYFKINVDDQDYFLVIQFDEKHQLFYVGITDQEAPEKFTNKWPLSGVVSTLIKADSAIYMEYTLKELFKEKPGVTSITLDLTWNSGGNVGALYRVLGFITDKSFRVSSYNRGSKAGSSSYVYIDGLPSYPNLKWSLLISPKTFSAGNSMATIFKENKLGLIIGSQTGGGTSSITPILLPSGTAFIMSSNSISSLRIGTGTESDPYKYIDNEFGIAPDYELSIEDLYNEILLLNILKNQ